MSGCRLGGNGSGEGSVLTVRRLGGNGSGEGIASAVCRLAGNGFRLSA